MTQLPIICWLTQSFTGTSVTFKCFTVGLITACPMENKPQQNQNVHLFFFFQGLGFLSQNRGSQQAEPPCCHVQRQLTHLAYRWVQDCCALGLGQTKCNCLW